MISEIERIGNLLLVPVDDTTPGIPTNRLNVVALAGPRRVLDPNGTVLTHL